MGPFFPRVNQLLDGKCVHSFGDHNGSYNCKMHFACLILYVRDYNIAQIQVLSKRTFMISSNETGKFNFRNELWIKRFDDAIIDIFSFPHPLHIRYLPKQVLTTKLFSRQLLEYYFLITVEEQIRSIFCVLEHASTQ